MITFQNNQPQTKPICLLNILLMDTCITLCQHCHRSNLLVHTGVVPVNEPSASQRLVRSPAE